MDNELQIIALTEEEEWLLRKVLEAFEEHNDEEAALLCRQVIQLRGEGESEARHYLQLLDQRSDELLFAEACNQLRLGNLHKAYRQFHSIVNLNKGRQADANRHITTLNAYLRNPIITVPKPIIPPFSDIAVETTDRPAEAIIKRTPHMNLAPEPVLQPDSVVNISVFLDKEPAREGEDSEELTFASLPGVDAFEVEVRLLATGHFVIEENKEKKILIKRDEASSNSADFKARVKSREQLALTSKTLKAGFTAVFAYNGRICGKVARAVVIAGPQDVNAEDIPAEAVEVKPTDSARMALDATAKPADLSVEVIAQSANDGRHYWCNVRTPLLEKYRAGITEEWNLPDVTTSIVSASMSEFTTKGMGKEQRLAALRGAGIALFEASPKVFQRIFWELIDAERIPETISIVSEEPFIPWELMIPRRKVEGQPRQRQPIGVEFIMARWTPKQAISGRQKIRMTDCYVIAPQYVDKAALKYAQDESDFMLKKFPAPAGHAVKPANFENLNATFKNGGKTIIHFACHGATKETGKQVIYLESEPPLSPETLRGMIPLEQAFADKPPFVFLNACEIGRQVPSLSGVGGFAQSFIDMGASAVIAPLWSVKDKLAHEIALEFYNAVSNDPDKSFAAILRDIRAKAYDPEVAEDTYAAYCFYGDPLGSSVSN